MTSFFALKYDVHNVHCGLFRQSSSQRLIFVLYPIRLRQIKCNTVWETKIRVRDAHGVYDRPAITVPAPDRVRAGRNRFRVFIPF